jgi:tRNA (guanine37-N1)-methyltransferase
MRIDIITLFPGIFDGFLNESLLKEAIRTQRLAVHLHNLRDWANDRHQKVDDTPYGGGPGMVLMVDRVVPCVEEIRACEAEPGRLILLSPQGKRLTQPLVEELATEKRLLMLCGRYEGFDERVFPLLEPEEISIGDYVLNGGEVAAMAVLEAVMRLIPGVLGDAESFHKDSFSLTGQGRLLECAQYTRPREYRGLSVPEILLNGNHQAIESWRQQNAQERTAQKRPDILKSEPQS